MSLSPYLRCFFTDVTGGLVNHQMLGKCQRQEMMYMDCLEAYGLDRGKEKCKYLFDDYHECASMTKQFKRFIAMRKERERQISCGLRKGCKMYESPRVDSF